MNKINRRRLKDYRPGQLDTGASVLTRICWYIVSQLLFENGWFPVSLPKVWILRFFGAKIGDGVVLRPNVRIKFPWKLAIGSDSWIGQSVWIDNLSHVEIGSDVCISQGVYLCTGDHDRRSETFELITGPIRVDDGAWLACRSIVLRDVTIGRLAVVAAGKVASKDVSPGTVWI